MNYETSQKDAIHGHGREKKLHASMDNEVIFAPQKSQWKKWQKDPKNLRNDQTFVVQKSPRVLHMTQQG